MKHTSPTLLVIAALVAAPGAHALSVKDDDVKLGLGLVIQARAELSSAKADDGDPYSPAEGGDIESDTVDFYLRRARLSLKGSWKDEYVFAFTIRADGSEQEVRGDGKPSVGLYEAMIGRKWKLESGIEHGVEFGLIAPTYNAAGNVYSSSAFLLSNEASTAALMTPRGGGVKWHLSAPFITAFVDVNSNQKGLSGDGDSDTELGYDNTDGSKGEGLWTSARVHLSPEGDWKISKPTESFAGEAGKGIMVGLDYAQNTDDRDDGPPVQTYDSTGYGIDLLVHFDGLTALAEYRVASTEAESTGVEQEAVAWRIQAGYAFPMGDTFLEPAVRYSKLDLNKDNDAEGAEFGSKDYGSSGTQLEIGLNWYLHSHKNKMQLAWLSWQSEGAAPGEEEAEATITRFQWQLSF